MMKAEMDGWMEGPVAWEVAAMDASVAAPMITRYLFLPARPSHRAVANIIINNNNNTALRTTQAREGLPFGLLPLSYCFFIFPLFRSCRRHLHRRPGTARHRLACACSPVSLRSLVPCRSTANTPAGRREGAARIRPHRTGRSFSCQPVSSLPSLPRLQPAHGQSRRDDGQPA